MVIWLDAGTGQEALDKAMNLLPPKSSGKTYYCAEGSPAEELSPAREADLRAFQEMLAQAVADADAGITITDDQHPGVLFSPAAVAALTALEAEGNTEA